MKRLANQRFLLGVLLVVALGCRVPPERIAAGDLGGAGQDLLVVVVDAAARDRGETDGAGGDLALTDAPSDRGEDTADGAVDLPLSDGGDALADSSDATADLCADECDFVGQKLCMTEERYRECKTGPQGCLILDCSS